MRKYWIVAAFVIGAAIGGALGAVKWRGNIEHWHRLGRMQALLAQAEQMPAGSVLVIGDSITEMIRFDRLCGRPAVNAGISQSTSATWTEDAERLVEAYRPSKVILAVGTNDRGQWHDDYRKLAAMADFAVEPADRQKAAFIRTVIRTVPAHSSTIDGIHPSARGAAEWLNHVESGC